MSSQEQSRRSDSLEQLRTLSLKAASAAKPYAQKAVDKLAELFDQVNFFEIAVLWFIVKMLFVFPMTGINPYYEGLLANRLLYFHQACKTVIHEIIVILIIKIIFKLLSKFGFNRNFKNNLISYWNNTFKPHWKEILRAYWKKFCKTFNAVDISVLLFLGFVLISVFFSDDRELSFYGELLRNNGFLVHFFYVLIYFIISRFVRMRKIELNLYCFSGTVVSTLLLLQFFGHDVLKTEYTTPAFVGPMGNIDFTSYVLTVTLILAGAVYVTEQHIFFDKDGYVALACFAASLWAELVISVDSGIAAIGAALFVGLPLLLISRRRVGRFFTLMSVGMGTVIFKRLIVDVDMYHLEFEKKGWLMLAAEAILIALAVIINSNKLKLNPSRKVMLAATICIDCLAVACVLAAAHKAADGEPSKDILYELGQVIYYHNLDDHFGSGRMIIWKISWQMAKINPLFGLGPESFRRVMMEKYENEITSYYGNTMVIEAHNEYLHLLISSGVMALGAFLAFLGLMIAKGFKRAKDDPMLVCCVMGVVGYAAHAFFMPALTLHTPLMWVLLGFTGSAIRTGEGKQKALLGEKYSAALQSKAGALRDRIHEQLRRERLADSLRPVWQKGKQSAGRFLALVQSKFLSE